MTSPRERRGRFQFKHQLPTRHAAVRTVPRVLHLKTHDASRGLNTITRVKYSLLLIFSPADPSGILGVNDLSTTISFPSLLSVRCVVSHPSGVALSVRCTGPRCGISLYVVLRYTTPGSAPKSSLEPLNSSSHSPMG